MKKRYRKIPAIDTLRETGITEYARRRRFQLLMKTSDAAFTAVRFKPKKGKLKRWFPIPYMTGRIARAARFVWP